MSILTRRGARQVHREDGRHGGEMTNMEMISPIRGDEDVGGGDKVADQQRWQNPRTVEMKKPVDDNGYEKYSLLKNNNGLASLQLHLHRRST
uniref:Uncharacterized protein n=1 Tax=Oryza punctata TaxID=4537 RepID=A0A0E0JZG8_ORYPU